MLFQSTPSLRKVTFLLCTRMLLSRFQSTPSLRKVTEQDLRPRIPDQFQSTPSLRKVTDEDGEIGRLDNISIHTFLAEGDYNAAGLYQNQYLFQSTPSLRKVTLLFDDCLSLLQFQSTPSVRKVTQSQLGGIVVTPISIHTFLAEGDITDIKQSISNIISIHTFLAEGDFVDFLVAIKLSISIHTFLAEGDGSFVCHRLSCFVFQSTPSLRKVTTVNIAGMHF